MVGQDNGAILDCSSGRWKGGPGLVGWNRQNDAGRSDALRSG